MRKSTDQGLNKTGIKMSPLLSKEMLTGQEEFFAPQIDSSISPFGFHKEYIDAAESLGSVPLPTGGAKGAQKTSLQKSRGKHPVVLMDKLAERLAFERTGVRLYDALITKCEARAPDLDFTPLHKIREDEARHFEMLRQTIKDLGADPTAQTPCADLAGVEGFGLVQVLNDARTDIRASAHAILVAELIDNEGWNTLIEIAKSSGMEELVEKFERAKSEEDQHLRIVRPWLQKMTMEDEATEPASYKQKK